MESRAWREILTHRFIPVNGDSGAVDVGGTFVFKVLEARITRFLQTISDLQDMEALKYLSIAGLEAEMEEASNAILSSSRRVVHDKAEAVNVLVELMLVWGIRDIPFALASVLLNDGLARFDLSKPRSPTFKILVRGIRHKATDVNIGDAFGILETFGETELFLVGPKSWDSTRNWRITRDKFVQVDHFIRLVVSTLHRLNWSRNVLCSGCRCGRIGHTRVILRLTLEAHSLIGSGIFFIG